MLENICQRRGLYHRQPSFFYFFPGSRSGPDEDRLLKHLFDEKYQPHNLLTAPIRNISDHVDVHLGITLMNLVALVKLKDAFICWLCFILNNR